MIVVVIIGAAVGAAAIYTNTGQKSTSKSTTSTTTPTSSITISSTGSSFQSKNFIFINSGMSLCSGNCLYPSPYLSGTVFVNSSVPLKTLQLYINGTYEGTSNYTSNFTNYAIGYKSSPTNQSMPIVSGRTYLITLFATFQDESVSSASIVVVADSTSTETSQAQQISTSCIIQGQPGALQLRILSDSTLQPLVGANVSATNTPALCNNVPATTHTGMKFTTNGTDWYYLPTDNEASFSFVVSYSGQIYTLKAGLMPIFVTCATLYVPSGKTNITTTEFQSSC
jgi:hypothetical protein